MTWIKWFTVCLLGCVWAGEPEAVYLSWVGDPSSSMVVRWLTTEEGGSGLYFRPGEGAWQQVIGAIRPLEGVSMVVHEAELLGLKEDTEYEFRIDRQIHRFRTMPTELTRPVKFVVGGDAYHESVLYRRMNGVIGAYGPDFVVVGGDIAYTVGFEGAVKGRSWEADRWLSFFRKWQSDLTTKEGRLIPILPVVGNHDVKKGKPKGMFYDLFAFPEPGRAYRAVDFGRYLSLILLDTGHTAPIEGAQTEWLAGALAKRAGKGLVMAVYHIAAYPTRYDYAGSGPQKIRENWVPLFEKYDLPVAFEHHNHCYKRSHRIREGKVDESGVLYLGDGSWGVPPQKPKSDLWYVAKALRTNSCLFVQMDGERLTIEPRGNTGVLIDEAVEVRR